MKRLFSMIAAPVMALFAGANAAAPAASTATAENPPAIVEEAPAEQEQAPEGVDPQDAGLSGKVTAIDGSSVTVVLAERPALPEDNGTAPALPADGQQPADNGMMAKPADDQTPPEKPADDAAPEKLADDAAPEKPDGEAPAKPEDGVAPEMNWSTEPVTYDLSNATITVENDGVVTGGSLSDITVDSLLLLKADENGTIIAVTVLAQG